MSLEMSLAAGASSDPLVEKRAGFPWRSRQVPASVHMRWVAAIGRDPLTRARSGPRPRESSAGGLGLGLTLVRSLMELHGGGVDVASAGPGGGSRFTIWLPLRHEVESAAGV